jgi:hypothetical protein
MFGTRILPKSDITYLEKELLKDGKFQFKNKEFFKNVPENDVMIFCLKHAFYLLPTLELVEFLKSRIKDKRTIEIGSGNGYLAERLNILATDSYMQDNLGTQLVYTFMQQPTVTYGKNVFTFTANEAVIRYTPEITIGCWVTHKYDPIKHEIGGNMVGIIEEDIIKNTKEEYIFIGHKNTHKLKPILSLPHETIELDGLVSRNGYQGNVIWIFKNEVGS